MARFRSFPISATGSADSYNPSIACARTPWPASGIATRRQSPIGYVAPVGKKTWLTQSTWVQPIVGSQGTVYMYWGDHWYGDQDTTAPGVHNYLTTYVFQPLVFTGTAISMPTYEVSWKIDIGAGTWSAN
jgi:hypothetical protein